eukprot:TRINITY_DN513_c0_g2_i3.p1 TRINITY_DN513_c0_g2~~TRINITY_DN513_c0_g2_i3.p1  ORF type:complete len:352 (-),score=137.13 TRINITY_DN513_c0_g2_i3:85-1140(-)
MKIVWGVCGLCFWVGGYLVGHNSDFGFGDLVTVFGMMLFAVLGLSQGFAALPEILKGRASFKRIEEIIKRQPLINFEGGNKLNNVTGSVSFENVTFKYPTRDINVLKDISFNIQPGQSVAFVGESGSGKSTCFSLIERFYDVNQGFVKIDGTDIRTLDPRWLHNHISMVSQEPVLFSTTIKENISYAKEDATMDEIIQAAKDANAYDFIVKLPNGFDTQCGERGSSMSGGQKQRIAIARSILASPEILLLDEATSALDTESERLVQQALDKLMVNRTSLVIAHRLATVKKCDVIFVLSDGELIDYGTHEELLDNSEIYSTLARRQLTLHNYEEDNNNNNNNNEIDIDVDNF